MRGARPVGAIELLVVAGCRVVVGHTEVGDEVWAEGRDICSCGKATHCVQGRWRRIREVDSDGCVAFVAPVRIGVGEGNDCASADRLLRNRRKDRTSDGALGRGGGCGGKSSENSDNDRQKVHCEE